MPDLSALWSQIYALGTAVFDYLSGAGGYGAFFGLLGMLIQLWLRAEWPTSRLNAGSPGVMDPTRFVIAVAVAMVTGLAAAHYFPVGASSYKTCAEFGCWFPSAWWGNAIAIIAFGYVAADLVPNGIEKLTTLLKSFLQLIGVLPKKPKGT